MVTEGELTVGSEHTMPHTDDVSQNQTLAETNTLLLTSVPLNKLKILLHFVRLEIYFPDPFNHLTLFGQNVCAEVARVSMFFVNSSRGENIGAFVPVGLTCLAV